MRGVAKKAKANGDRIKSLVLEANTFADEQTLAAIHRCIFGNARVSISVRLPSGEVKESMIFFGADPPDPFESPGNFDP